MSIRAFPRVLSIPPGAPFLPTLVEALLSGRLVPGFRHDGDPLALGAATIYVPTRRAARELRGVLLERLGGISAILPTIRPLGDFDEEQWAFEAGDAAALDLPPPVPALDRLLLLAPLVRAWKRRLPAHVVSLFAEEVVVPASTADSVWLARDLAALIDEIETAGSDWTRLSDLVSGDLAGWWQVTLDFLGIVTENWPKILDARGQSNPAGHRAMLIRREAARLLRDPPAGPVVAAGSTGSLPATAELLSAIARLPSGAVVLPGLDRHMDERSWAVLNGTRPEPAVQGHPQFGLARLLGRIGVTRADVEEIAEPEPALALRAAMVSEALRPAETTDEWAAARKGLRDGDIAAAFAGIRLVEAAHERDEAAAIAVALREAITAPDRRAALLTADRELARRVSSELLRFGVRADDSGGAPLSSTPPGVLAGLLLQAAFAPGDPVPILALLKHPLLQLGLERPAARHAAETVELVALRGGTGRPDIAALDALLDRRRAALAATQRPPFWTMRLSEERLAEARSLAARLAAAVSPLAGLRGRREVPLADMVRTTVVALENLGRDAAGSVAGLYAGDAGEAVAGFLRGLVAAEVPFLLDADEWPDVFAALMAPEIVKPAQGADPRVSIWGALEARLQSVDLLVVGGLNEGTWPGKAQADRFMSRLMKTGIDLDPPERRIGQAAHDFVMALGAREIVLSRSARAGDAPAVQSRWLQRLLTFAGPAEAAAMKARGDGLLDWARALDAAPQVEFAPRPRPKPPLAVRPTRFSVTEIETLRRDPYAIYARRILALSPLDPLLREPGAAERGTLFHAILHRFAMAEVDPGGSSALGVLLSKGRECFAEADLPADVAAIWWPRFERLAEGVIAWERGRGEGVTRRWAEARAAATAVGGTGVTLSGYADRIDLLPAGMADILDYKTGSGPSKGQAHTLVAPQLALEGALLARGAFKEIGRREPAELAYVRLKPDGEVVEESILEYDRQVKSAPQLSEEAWQRLEKLLDHYRDASAVYLSRALPFREGEFDGDYDHLARVLEWSAGGDGDKGGEAS